VAFELTVTQFVIFSLVLTSLGAVLGPRYNWMLERTMPDPHHRQVHGLILGWVMFATMMLAMSGIATQSVIFSLLSTVLFAVVTPYHWVTRRTIPDPRHRQVLGLTLGWTMFACLMLVMAAGM
jgi:polyferredoxin